MASLRMITRSVNQLTSISQSKRKPFEILHLGLTYIMDSVDNFKLSKELLIEF